MMTSHEAGGRWSLDPRLLCALACAVAFTGTSAEAQIVPTGFQDYFVLGYEQHVWDMMSKVEAGEGGGAFANAMNSLITAVASADNQIIYYDHWEDGLEADIFNPVQASTLIIGDANPANGDACDFNADPCGVDLLGQGDFVNFGSNQGILAGCTVPSASPLVFTELCSSVPVNPRCAVAGACTASEVRFDGGDFVQTSGGPLSIVHSQDPLTQFIGGSTEMLSKQAVAAALSYSIPVGEDLYPAFGCPNCVMEPFHYVDLNIVAFEDGTNVFVDSPGAGTVSFTLNKGEHWSSLGSIDETVSAALQLTINSGTKISTTAPISGMLFTGGDGTWATRHYTLLPDLLHSTDYLITAPGDDPAITGSTPNRPLNLYLFNPDPLNAVTVTTVDSVGTTAVLIPANSVVDYFTATGRFVPNGSTVRMTSDRNFWGISAYDYDTNISDWGHSWLATKFLTQNYTVSFAPGTLNPPVDMVNFSAVFVAATADNTRVQIDFDNDGVFDVIDLDGDGVPDPAPLPNNTYVVNALGSLRVFDWNDFDNTGTRIVANKPVGVAWGQDTDLTDFGDTALDTGYTVYPTNQLFLDPVLTLDKNVDLAVVPTAGGIATYTLTISSFGFGPITSLLAYDLLPTGVVGTDYVPGSTLVTYPDLTQDTTDPVASIDPATGRDRLDWTLSPDTMGTNQTLTVRYQVAIPAAPGGLPRVLNNEGHAQGNLGSSIFSPSDIEAVIQTDILLTKSVADDGTPEPGDVLTYTLNVTNNGLAAETGASISDAIPPNTTFLPGSVTSSGPFAGAYSAAQNAVVWTAANFPVGGPHALTFQVTVNPGVPAGTIITNTANYESVQTPLFPALDVDTTVVGPLLTATKSGPALLHPNEIATFDITIENTGAGNATNVLVVDFFPANATYVSESMQWRLNSGPFTSVTDAADADEGTEFVDRLELLVATLGANEDITFRYDVLVDPGTDGLFVNNQANVSSTETLPRDTNLVQVPIVGASDVTGHVFLDLDGDGAQGGGEPDLANVDVLVTDSTGNTQVVSTDANGDYIASVDVGCYSDNFPVVAYDGSQGILDWSGAGDEWTEFGAVADGDPTTIPLLVEPDPLGVFGSSLLIEGGPAASTRGFTRQADLSGFAGGFISFNFRRVSMEAADFVDLLIDYGSGPAVVQNFPGIGTDGAWQSFSVALDSGQLPASPVVFTLRGTNFNFANDNFYVDNVRVCNSQVTVNVDETDPDFPVGATLSTANDPQTLQVVSGGSVAATPVGYQPPPLTFTKTSGAGGEVLPGETITYSVELTNTSSVTQTGIDIADPLPAGTTASAGSTSVSVTNPALRVTEYLLAAGSFTGTSFDLVLNQALATDYFVIAQGSDGDTTGGGNRGPDENYVSLTQDPFGTGGLGVSGGASTLRFQRGNAVNSWVGVVTVVECLANCTVDGFTLRDVQRVAHAGAGTAGAVATTNPWTDINQVMLLGGFNGAGCDTAETGVANTKVCHVRLFPSAADQINWTRDAGGATLSAATSTVMVLEWGSAWRVQRVRVQGGNGGDGADAVGEYNTTALAAPPVARANTWVWGTGHTNDQGIGDAAEAVLLTLGDGVNQNATESTVAAGIELAGNAIDFEVYALTHSQLATDYQFKADGDTGNLTVDVAVASATSNRMALSYNGQNGTGNAYPRPMLSARYLNDTTVRLERRRSGQPFPAWVQGIDFSQILGATVAAGNDPPGLVVPADAYTLAPGATMTVTFQVVVDDPLAGGITQIVNTATLNTDQQGPLVASATDDVVRLAVIIEPNNAGTVIAGQSITYSHFVTNSGSSSDSYAVTVTSELGYTVELIDPATGTVIATDTNGDGVWDGGITVNTGTLNPGESLDYRVRVTVPGGTPVGTQETTTLAGTSDRKAAIGAFATDETIVVGPPAPSGMVFVTPDHSGVVIASGSIAYSHLVTNDTGATDTFDLFSVPTLPGWMATVYWDTNGDGVYSPGIDVAINNTSQLADGQSQLVFVVVDAPVGATAGDLDVTTLTAISRNDTSVFDSATDTTTVISATPELDLSGGGTQLTDVGLTPAFPGTIKNLAAADDRFDFSITASSLAGVDGLNHPTQLFVDTDADGIPDLEIARDDDGDGVWDFIEPGFDTNSDLSPDVAVAAGAELAYELRRTVPAGQVIRQEFVTLTTTAQASGSTDSVTATNLLAVATRVTIEGVRIDPNGVVEFATGMQRGTRKFHLYQTNDPRSSSGRELISLEPVRSPHANSNLPTLYRVNTARITEPYVIIEEIEHGGARNAMGPFRVGDQVLADAFERMEALFDRLGVADGSVRPMRGGHMKRARHGRRSERSLEARRRRRPSGGRSFEAAKVLVNGAGVVDVPLVDLAAAGLDTSRPRRLKVTSQGRRVSFRLVRGGVRGPSISFVAEPLATDFTRSNVYVVSRHRPRMTSELTASSVPLTPGAIRIEKSTQYLASIPLEHDPWVWDFLLGDGNTWPYFWSMPDTGSFDVPGLAPGATGPVPIDVGVVAFTEHVHSLTAYVNGSEIGTLEFSGPVRETLRGSVPAEALLAAGNQLTIMYSATSSETGLPDPSAVLLLDYLELRPTAGVVPLGPIAAADVLPFDSRLPRLRRVDYLIVTHPLFREQADRLAGLKELDGLSPVVVETEQAYDRFSGGIPEPLAIQALIRHVAARSRQLRFVVLIGDDSFDALDHLGTGAESFVPSVNVWDGEFGRVPSQHPYSDLDDDGLPDLAIGRIPVQTPEQASAVVDKIEAQADVVAASIARHVFAVDNHTEADVPFRDEAEAVAAQLAPGSSVQWSDVAGGIAAARSDLRTGWQTAGMVHYFGHGGPALWADENLLSSSTVGDLDGASQPALVFTWGCQAQWHQYLFGPSVNEALLLLPGGGATATFGPAGITAPASQQPLYQRFYAHLFEGEAPTLGEVILDAKRQALVEKPESRFAVEGFLLFGDPALPLPRD